MTKLEDRIDMGSDQDPRSPVNMVHAAVLGGGTHHNPDSYGQYADYNMSYMDHTNLHLNTYNPHQIHSG